MADNMHYDAIVVGSGISGGWAAKELTERGLKVLMLERGRNVEHLTDYENADKESWDYPHRGSATVEMKDNYPVLSRDYPLNEQTHGMWENERLKASARRARLGRPDRGGEETGPQSLCLQGCGTKLRLPFHP
ncbi:NAD(P)-binding protein [Limimaricola cinnabarinus]|uniref:NAD(P)-binding protein n=1 Tax=Limimaricola cinnabarinus TaxID=1125964 RepID=UPI00248FABC0|nr:NAD(P)-binding protein [Limimaricola cinnabarinus]